MKWKTKALIQNLISLLPDKLSYKSYLFFQKKFGGLRNFNPINKLATSKKVWEKILAGNQQPSGGIFFEVGTGRVPIVPIGYFLMGAKKVVTIDLNPYLDLELLVESLNYMKNNPNLVRETLGDYFDEDRFQILRSIDTSSFIALEQILNSLLIEYIAPGDATDIKMESNSFDFYISCTVLEHISENVISKILEEGRRVLKPSGLAIHGIDYSDHFSHSDTNISAINFLQYSDEKWDRYAANRYMYMNRLRHSEFIRLFKEAGYLIEGEKVDRSESITELLKSFELDARFVCMDHEDLAVTSAWLTLSPNKMV